MKFKSDHNIRDLAQKKPEMFSRPTATYSDEYMDPKFYIQYGKYILGMYVRDLCIVSSDGVLAGSKETISNLRLYARGEQSTAKYQNILDPKDNSEIDKGYMNISWRNHRFLKTFVQLAVSKIMKSNVGFNINAIDTLSKNQKTKLVNTMKLMTRKPVKELMINAGVMPDGVPKMNGIDSEKDVEDLLKMGKLILPVEIEMKDGVDAVLRSSNYDFLVQRNLIRDIVICSGGSCHVYEKEATGEIVTDYLDIQRLVAPYSTKNDLSDVHYIGYINQITIRELREKGLGEKQLFQVAQKYRNEYGNASNIYDPLLMIHDSTIRNQFIMSNGCYPEDTFKVDELIFYFVGGATERKIINQETNEFIAGGTFHNVYKANWIINTETVYGYGLERNIVRKGEDGHKTVVFPIKAFILHEPSMVENSIGITDDIQIAVLKKRQAISKMIPGPRIAIDMSKLNPFVTIGKQRVDILESLELFPKTGIFVYSSKKHSSYDEDDRLSQGPPLDFMTSGVMEDLNIFTSEIQTQINYLNQTTGINKFEDGTLDNQRMLKDVVQGMRMSSANAIQDEFGAYLYVYCEMLKYIVEKFRVKVLSGDIDLAGLYGIDVTMTKKIFKNLFTINIQLLPGEEEKQKLLSKLEQIYQGGQIDPAAYFVVDRLINEGDYAKAEIYLAKSSETFMAKQHKMKLEESSAQSQAQAAADKEMKANEFQLKQKEHLWRMEEIREKARWELDKERLKLGASAEMNDATIKGRQEEQNIRNLSASVVDEE